MLQFPFTPPDMEVISPTVFCSERLILQLLCNAQNELQWWDSGAIASVKVISSEGPMPTLDPITGYYTPAECVVFDLRTKVTVGKFLVRTKLFWGGPKLVHNVLRYAYQKTEEGYEIHIDTIGAENFIQYNAGYYIRGCEEDGWSVTFVAWFQGVPRPIRKLLAWFYTPVKKKSFLDLKRVAESVQEKELA